MQILNRWNLKVIFECKKETIKETVCEANLREADLREANLYGADLREADLYGANLYGANLYGADLYGADLYGADLRGADLRGANLRGADLYGANLRGADLRGADLREADLRGADFIQINLPYYQVVVQKEHTRIGCKYYSNVEWKNFSDVDIKKMATDAFVFWSQFKQLIFTAMDSLQDKGN